MANCLILLSLLYIRAATAQASRIAPESVFGVTFDFDSKKEVTAAGLISTTNGTFFNTLEFPNADDADQGSGLVAKDIVAVYFTPSPNVFMGLINISAKANLGSSALDSDNLLELLCVLHYCYAVRLGDDSSDNAFVRIDPFSGRITKLGNLSRWLGLREDSASIDVEHQLYHVMMLDENENGVIVTLNTTSGHVVHFVPAPNKGFSGPMCVDAVVGLVTLDSGEGTIAIAAVDWHTGNITSLRSSQDPIVGIPSSNGIVCKDGFLIVELIDFEKIFLMTVDLRATGAPTIHNARLKYLMHAMSAV